MAATSLGVSGAASSRDHSRARRSEGVYFGQRSSRQMELRLPGSPGSDHFNGSRLRSAAAALFSPSEVAARERPAGWRTAIDAAFTMEISFLGDACERAAGGGLWRSEAGCVSVITSDLRFGHMVQNGWHPGREPRLLILRQSGGRCSLRQRGNREIYVARDVTVLDGSETFDGDMSGQGGGVWLSIPLSEVRKHYPRAQNLAGVRIDGSTGAGALASDFVGSLATHIERTSRFQTHGVIRPLLELLELAGRERLGTPQPATKQQALRSVRQYIADRLASNELTPNAIAESHGVSRRQLDKWFSDQPLSVSQYIWEQRLLKCRQALVDPLNAHLPIIQIAVQWGFNSSAHFSRAFKSRFGTSPSRWRVAGLRQFQSTERSL